MSQIPAAFFQVAATAIPTLLVAVAVGMKEGTNLARELEESRGFRRPLLVVVVILLVMLVAWAEMLALLSLVKGTSDQWAAIWVYMAIAALIALVLYEFTWQMEAALGKFAGNVFFATVLLATAAPFLAFMFLSKA